MLGKNRSKIGLKNVLYIHTNIITKKCGEKNARNNFSRNTRIVRAKNVGKKIDGIMCKKVFYIHTDIVTKKGGKKRAVQFFQKHTNCAAKNVGKKIVGKKCEKTFLYSHEYRDQKKG